MNEKSVRGYEFSLRYDLKLFVNLYFRIRRLVLTVAFLKNDGRLAEMLHNALEHVAKAVLPRSLWTSPNLTH